MSRLLRMDRTGHTELAEWTAGDTSNTFDPFEVISKDGFTMQLEVRVVFRVKPEDASFMVPFLSKRSAIDVPAGESAARSLCATASSQPPTRRRASPS